MKLYIYTCDLKNRKNIKILDVENKGMYFIFKKNEGRIILYEKSDINIVRAHPEITDSWQYITTEQNGFAENILDNFVINEIDERIKKLSMQRDYIEDHMYTIKE